jgi:pyruvate-formate lyase-activating enzyme
MVRMGRTDRREIQGTFHHIPNMLYADGEGNIYDHPYYRMAGFSGREPVPIEREDVVPVPEFSKLFFIPQCPPVGLDPETGEYAVVPEAETEKGISPCCGIASFLEPGLVRTHLPAVDYTAKDYALPMWAYTAVGFKDGRYWTTAFPVEVNPRWDPRNYDDLDLVPAIEKYRKEVRDGPLVEHLVQCATVNHCFAAKNLFLGRWEGPIPVSQACNASCLGCLSFQPDHLCEESHRRLSFRPSRDEIVDIAVAHLERAPHAIMSFGQGCEGEPLTEYELIAESVKEIRERTGAGTINLNTNGSRPDRVRRVAEAGLDSIRISLNSPREEFYRAYYRPKNYHFSHVVESIAAAGDLGLYTMVNYLVFPGISDQEAEMDAMLGLVERTGLNFLHLKNLCIDPALYLAAMPKEKSRGVGMKRMADTLKNACPDLQLGYFNQPVR